MSQPNNPAAALMTERLISAAPHQVFAAIENPASIAQWWGPNGFTNTISLFEFRSGGRWHLTMHGPNGTDYPNELLFGEIERDAKVVFEHISKPLFTLTITLSPRGEKTHLTWVQQFESPEVADQLRSMCVPANEQNLDRLEAVLARL